MDCRFTNNQRVVSLRSPCKPTDGRSSVLDAYDSTFVPNNAHHAFRPSLSSNEDGYARQISLLASLIEPFAKNRSEDAAISLIDRFGSIDRALCASEPQITAVLRDYGELGKFIVAAHRLVETSYKLRLRRRTVTPHDPQLINLLRKRFKHSTIERIQCVFLSNKMGFIKEEEHSKGTVSGVNIHAGELVQRAFQLGANNLILAHNHLSGSCMPSEDDRAATHGLTAILEKIGLRLVDHLIFTEQSVFSFARNDAL